MITKKVSEVIDYVICLLFGVIWGISILFGFTCFVLIGISVILLHISRYFFYKNIWKLEQLRKIKKKRGGK